MRLLDVGSSEGSFIKAVAVISDGVIQAIGLEPNPAMYRTFQGQPQVQQAVCLLAAFGSAEQAGQECDVFDIPTLADGSIAPANEFSEIRDGRIVVRYLDDTEPFDIIYESETFQFIDNQREFHISRCREMLTSTGLLVCEEKVLDDAPGVYEKKEAKKDFSYKTNYFELADIDAKREQILKEMRLISWRELIAWISLTFMQQLNRRLSAQEGGRVIPGDASTVQG